MTTTGLAGKAHRARSASARRDAKRLQRGLFILLLALLGDTAVVWAQPVPVSAVAVSPAAEIAAANDSVPRAVRLIVGHSTVLEMGRAIARVSLTSADVADALVTTPQQLLVHGKTPGTISMFVWDRGGAIQRYEVVVQRDVAQLNEQVRQLFPGEAIRVESTGRNIVLAGYASKKEIADKAAAVAVGYVDKAAEVVNLLQIGETATGNQVLLRVRFAEVSRNAMSALGASFYADGYQNKVGKIGTDAFNQPAIFDQKKPMLGNSQVFSDFLNLFLFDAKNQIGAVVKALQTKGLFQSLAEPNLVAESGKEASFLAGGEFPIPVVQGSGANLAISVVFKEFGIRLNFTPTVSGSRVHLKVRPEVSTLDFNNAVLLQGFRIPALSTRRTETELELQDGQTFAIAGLMNSSVMSTLQKIPGIGDIPILGALFRSKQAQKDHTELVVMITPQILPQNSPGVTDALPRQPEAYLAPLPDKNTVVPPPPAFQPVRRGATIQPAITQPAGEPGAAAVPLSPAAAADIVSSLTVKGPKIMPAPAAADAPTTVTSTPAPAAARPLTPAEKKTLDHARQIEQQKQQAELRAKSEEAKRAAKQAEEQRRLEAKQREREEKLAREQARRDAKAAKKKAEADKRQAEIDRRQQRRIDEAATMLRAAETNYQAQLEKANGSQRP